LLVIGLAQIHSLVLRTATNRAQAWQEAMQAVTQAIALAQSGLTYGIKALLLMQKPGGGGLNEARIAGEMAYALNPSDFYAILAHGSTLVAEDPTKAADLLRRALRINPRGAWAYLIYCELARAHLIARDYSGGLEWAQRAQNAAPGQVHAHLAMALLQVGGNFARICSPFIAAALLVVVGASGTYFIIFGLFIFVLVTMYQISSTSSRPNRGETSVLQDLRIGSSYLCTHPRLLHAVLSFYFMTMLGMSSIVLMPGFAKDTLDSGTAGLGLLLGVAAASGFVTSVSVASLADSRRAPALLTVSSLVAGARLIATGLAPNLITAAVVGMFVGGGTSVFQTLNNAVALRRCEPAFYGRVASLMMIAWGLSNLVSLPVGFLGDAVGERAAFATLGVALCTMILFFALWGRQIDRKAGVQIRV